MGCLLLLKEVTTGTWTLSFMSLWENLTSITSIFMFEASAKLKKV